MGNSFMKIAAGTMARRESDWKKARDVERNK